MNTEHGIEDPQTPELAELFAEQARILPIDGTPLAAITERGRAAQRRRRTMLSVAAAFAFVVAGYGTFRLLRPGSGQIAVTNPTTQSTQSSATAVPTTVIAEPSSTANDTEPSSEVTTSSDAQSAGATSGNGVDDTGYDGAVAFRDGFLLTRSTYSEETLFPESTTMTFAFTNDGVRTESIGRELVVQGGAREAVVSGGTVAVSSLRGGPEPTMHIYWSEDLIDWTEESFPLSDVGKIGQIPQALVDEVQIAPLLTTFGVNGDKWVSSVALTFEAAGPLAQEYDPDGGGTAFLRDGLHVYDDDGGEQVISPDQLGVSADDLAVFPGWPSDLYVPVLSGRRGSAEVALYEGDYAPPSPVPFGDGFAGMTELGQAVASDDGGEWRPLVATVGPDERITAVSPLGDQLLVVTASDRGSKSYRLAADGSTTFLSDVPLPADYSLTGADFEFKPGVFTVSTRPADLPEQMVSITADYEVTIQFPEPDAGENVKIHYFVTDRSSGEVIVENDGEPGHDYRDGVEVMIFTDADGRPEVVIPLEDLDDTTTTPSEPPTSGPTAGAPTSDDPSEQGAAVGDLEFAEFATADGVHWYQNRGYGEELLLAVSGNKLLVIDVASDGYKVVDLAAVAK